MGGREMDDIKIPERQYSKYSTERSRLIDDTLGRFSEINERTLLDFREELENKKVLYNRYTKEEVKQIIESEDISSKRLLSYSFFLQNNFYAKILIHYATFFDYIGVLIPGGTKGNNIKYTDNKVIKRYNQGLEFLDTIPLQKLCTQIALKTMINGMYCGITIPDKQKNSLLVYELPLDYCHTDKIDAFYRNIVQFDLSYFDTKTNREQLLKGYPKFIQKAYKKYSKGKNQYRYVILPPELTICTIFYGGSPLFINLIPAITKYNDSVDIELERQLNDITKLLVQHIPHNTSTNELLFEPPEAKSMHEAAVKMMGEQANTRVLTTYADVDSVTTKVNADTDDNIQKMYNNIYANAGVAGQIFASTSNYSIEASLRNDLCFMRPLLYQLGDWVQGLINYLYSSPKIVFNYFFPPITQHLLEDYITNSFKLASSGYSFILPGLAMGLSQRQLVNIKTLENQGLELEKVLIPLSSSYTQSNSNTEETNGRPALEVEDKTEKTIQNEDSQEES